MNADKIFGVAGAIVVLAMIATAVQSSNTAGIIESIGSTFSQSIRAARGN
jgi:hypothetical protein